MRFAAASLVALVLLPSVGRAAPESLRGGSPFAPPATAAAEQPVDPGLAAIEFTGVVVIDQKPRFNLRDPSANRSFWIRLGETEGGLRVTHYDRETGAITLEGRGGSRTLHLKQSKVVAPVVVLGPAPAGAAPPPAGMVPAAKPPPPPPPEPVNLTPKQRAQRQAENEARMLVSDLLEISMQERARFQEEQRRKAAAGGANPNPPPAPAPAPAK